MANSIKGTDEIPTKLEIVGVKYEDKFKKKTFSGREYSYYSDIEDIKVGDVVEVPTRYGKSIAQVVRTNIDEKEIEKIKTRGLTTFYFNSRENKDIQEYEGKQYNANYEFGGKVIENKDEEMKKFKTLIRVFNAKLTGLAITGGKDVVSNWFKVFILALAFVIAFWKA